MNDIEKMLRALNELGEKYGQFQGVTLMPNGACRVVWAQRSEMLQLAELLHLTDQQPPVPEWQVKLGRALAHQCRGELAEARALELEVQDILLKDAWRKVTPKT